MATLNVNIVGKTTGADNSIDPVIAKVKNDLKSISDTPIRITVDAKGFEAVSKQATSLLKAQANLVKEENRLAVEREKTAQATEKRLAEEVKLSAKVKEVTEEQKKANAAAKEQAQQYQDAVRAVKEYYAALRELQKANSDVGLTENGWESASGDWSSLADNLNRVTTAFNSLTDAENVNKLSEDQQIKLKQTMAKEAENYALQIEKAANKEANAAEQAKNTTQALSAEEMAMKSAEVVSKSYADGLGDIIAHQEKMVDGNVVEAMTKYRDEAGNVTKVVARLKDGQVQLSKTMDQASEATKKQADVAELASKKNSLLGDSLDRIIAKVSAWQLINWAVSSAIGTFRDAIQTIKEVDTQLVTIRKTTDLTEEEIRKLTDSTYELAAAYGRTADELLDLTATFARAGLHDQLEQMTELAALLENVGDIEGDTAAKFILAANAAWQLQGNYDSLMEIIDGMNAVTNQAAVDMEALTTGITVAGSVFANAGETAQTYTALVGSAVAATQRSGSEVARGLRTIAMNIRSIKGELEDGEIIDEASISDAAAALHSVGISVADANGELRLTSDVLADLAGKWNDLTTAEQAYLAESLAGKRQANVLTALMQNWSEVSRQMTLYAEGAGSALQENEIYLDSWEAKTKQLSAAWTNLIQGFVDTGFVKGLIETVTQLINLLDKGRAIIDLILPGIGAINFTKDFRDMFGIVKEADDAVDSFSRTTKDATEAVNDFGGAGREFGNEIATVSENTDEAVTTLKTLITTLDEVAGSFSVVESAFKDFEENGSLSYSTLSKIVDKFSDLNDDALAEYIRRLTDANLTGDDLNQIMGEMTIALINQKIAAEGLTAADKALIEKMLDEAGVANAAEVAEYLLAEAENTAAREAENATGAIEELNNTPIVTNNKLEAVSGLHEGFKSLQEQIWRTTQQLKLYKNEAADSDTWSKGKHKADKDRNGATAEFVTGSPGYEGTFKGKSVIPVFNYDGGSNDDDDDDDGKGRGSVRNTTTAKEEDKALTAIKEQIQAHKDKISLLKSELSLMKERGDSEDDLVAKMREIQAAEHQSAEYLRENADYWEELKIDQSDVNALSIDWWKIQNDINDLLEKTVDLREDELDAIQSSISLEKQKLEFLEESGKSVEEQIAQIKVIQKQLHNEAEQRRANLETLKASGASASELADAEAEIVKLSTEWWEYQNKIDKLLTKQAEEAEKKRKEQIKAAKEEALALLNAEEAAAKGPLQEELELLQAQDDALKDEREEAEKLLAVEKAREALINAQNERNIRQYNASTGQWEWVANASTVEKAQENLAKAEQALSDYYAKREIDALKERINAVGETYDKLRDAVNDFAEAVENGTASWDDAQSFLLSAIANFGEAVNTSAIAAASAFTSIVGGVTGAVSTTNSTGGSGGAGSNDLASRQDRFRTLLKSGNITSLNDFMMINGDTVYDWYNVAKSGGNAVEAWRDENGVGEYFRWHAAREGSGQDVVTWLAAGLSAGELTEEQVAEVLTQKIAEGVGSKTDQQALKLGLELLQNGQYYTYDGGGILRGIGGIKATKQDEMVLPPSATKAMLDAEQNGSFNALLRHLGIITAAAESYAGFGGSTTTRIGTQNNGDTYQFGNITLSEAQAKSMSVYDLACMAGELSLHNAM